MAKEITEEKITSFRNKNPQSLDTGQLEYTATTMLTYGTICLGLLTLSVTYIYLLIQKIKN